MESFKGLALLGGVDGVIGLIVAQTTQFFHETLAVNLMGRPTFALSSTDFLFRLLVTLN